MEHITIPDLRKEIERKRGEPLTDDGFQLLIAGFTAYASRRGMFAKNHLYDSFRRGWLSAQMAHFFRLYALE